MQFSLLGELKNYVYIIIPTFSADHFDPWTLLGTFCLLLQNWRPNNLFGHVIVVLSEIGRFAWELKDVTS